VVPHFDFAEPLGLTLADRLSRVSIRARSRRRASYEEDLGAPCVPDGASDAELSALGRQLGIPLPNEYAAFLRLHRYLLLSDGLEVSSLDHDGVHYANSPWVSEEHMPGRRFLVMGDYWTYADGDQLLVDLDDPQASVLVYLHEDGPQLEPFAPSVSLAIWRLVHEE
jgi:hypothetical protein